MTPLKLSQALGASLPRSRQELPPLRKAQWDACRAHLSWPLDVGWQTAEDTASLKFGRKWFVNETYSPNTWTFAHSKLQFGANVKSLDTT